MLAYCLLSRKLCPPLLVTILNRSCSIQHSVAWGNMNRDLQGCSFVKRDLTLIVPAGRYSRQKNTQTYSHLTVRKFEAMSKARNAIQFTAKPVTIVIENTLSRILKYDRNTMLFLRSLLGLKQKISQKSRDIWYWSTARGETRHHVPYISEIMYSFAKTSLLCGTL